MNPNSPLIDSCRSATHEELAAELEALLEELPDIEGYEEIMKHPDSDGRLLEYLQQKVACTKAKTARMGKARAKVEQETAALEAELAVYTNMEAGWQRIERAVVRAAKNAGLEPLT